MRLLIGCPYSDRGWILDKWIDHVSLACSKAGISDFQFVFVAGDKHRKDLKDLASLGNSIVKIVEEDLREDQRRWNDSRYSHMAFLRNELLSVVREESPDLFLSLDSDILLAEDSIKSAMTALAEHPDACAVGLKCYMSETTRVHPSMGCWSDGNMVRFYRRDIDDIATVDIIMAAKLMKPFAYNIDYCFHKNGEDLGWSSNVKAAGGKFIWDGRVTNKHVMSKNMLSVIDKRCGF